MPNHSFRCEICGREFEYEHAIIDTNSTALTIKCPFCFSNSISRIYTIPTIIYKGNGFYSTDNKKEGK
ncbi:MAG TPA: hypothetical protein DEG71_06970 [Clostridiales bacterium]|nr:hypothetical protein [Clostridiales bacterium]